MEQRPVTLTNLAYRLWSGTRCRQSATWVRSWSHDRAAGVPGRGADLVWGGMAVRSEVARLEGSPLAGLSADLAKFFDLVDPHIAIALLEEMGLPKEAVHPSRLKITLQLVDLNPSLNTISFTTGRLTPNPMHVVQKSLSQEKRGRS